MLTRRLLPSLLAVAAAFLPAGTAAAQTQTQSQTGEGAEGDDIPSVSVLPVPTPGSSADPNAGQWFVATGSPGQTVRLEARITNPAGIDQTVHLGLADLDFGSDGTPQVADTSDDVGTWGGFDQPTLTVPARGTVVAGFSMTVPEGAEPGDHVGVVLMESTPQGEGDIRVVKRVATRLYLTVPGDARPEFTIEGVTMARDSGIFPRTIEFTVVLRNTGRVRLHPRVQVNGKAARGSELLMSRSVEPYTVAVSVPPWGGPLRYTVEAATRTDTLEGPFRRVRVSTFVVPWALMGALVLLTALVFVTRRLLRRRVTRFDRLQAELRRLEQLIAGKAAAPHRRRGGTGAGDPETAIRTAIKRAARAGDAHTEERLKAALEERGRPARRPRSRRTSGGRRPQ